MIRSLHLTTKPLIVCLVGLCFCCLSVANDVSTESAASGGALETSDAEKLPEGHSNHGEFFNEGPRQAAYLMEGIGRIDFDVTSDAPDAVAFVQQGVGQLHGFWFFESERSFRQAAAIDPECAIAYWGMAMSNRKNVDRAKGFIGKAVDLKNQASQRERLYIEAFDRFINAAADTDEEKEERGIKYIADLESLLFEFPDDIEAKAFLCEFQWSARRDGLEFASYLAVDALIQQILDVEPMHSAHHYRIHLWDKKKPEKALHSAANCGPAAPSIAHMWHMPGHIYSRLHRYHDAVWQQEASARVDHAHMMKDMVLPDQIHNFAHNNEWCIRNLIHIGRVHDAVDLAMNMIELPRHPEYNNISKSGSHKYGRQRLIQVLQTFDMHDELIRFADTSWLQHTGDDEADLILDRALAASYVSVGRVADAEAVRAELDGLLTESNAGEQAAIDAAEEEARGEEKSADEITEAVRKAKEDHADRVDDLQAAIDEIDGRLAAKQGDFDTAFELFEEAEDVAVEDVVELLVSAERTDEALKKISDEIEENPNQVRLLAALIQTQWAADKKEEACESFESLRAMSSSIDLDVPVFVALADIAGELGYPADWRLEREMPSDLGRRPDLDTLGPFRWKPVAAPQWTLPGIDGVAVDSTTLPAEPRVVVFFLGAGCLHCAEQIQSFQPEAQKFRDAGIDLVAISTDPLKSLSRARENYDGDFAFKLFADPDMKVFRSYRCFDDFEQQPLHGTFVIDADGAILWQDISFEPFMDPEFVLHEAQRLLHPEKKIPEASPKSVAAIQIRE